MISSAGPHCGAAQHVAVTAHVGSQGRPELWQAPKWLPRCEVAHCAAQEAAAGWPKAGAFRGRVLHNCEQVLGRRSAAEARLHDLADSREFDDRGEERRGDHGGLSGEAARARATRAELLARLGEGSAGCPGVG